MLSLPQTQSTDNYPTQLGSGCSLGPTNFATGLSIEVFNASIDLQLYYFKDPQRRHLGIRTADPFQFPPAGQTYPGACAFAARSHVAGTPAQVLAQIWETADGPIPSSPLPITATLSPGGTLSNALIVPSVALASFPPTGPLDGQLVSLILPSSFDPVGGKSIRWLCEFDATNSVWHVRGPALYAEVQTAESPASTGVYVDMATVGPAITVPRTGDYIVGVGSAMTDANVDTAMSYQIGGTGAVDADSVDVLPPTAPAAGSAIAASIARDREKLALSTSTVLTAKYKTTGGGQNVSKRWLRLEPIRIS